MKALPAALTFILFATVTLQAQTTAPAAIPAAPAVLLPPQAPDVAAPKLAPDGQSSAGFIATHERFLGTAKEGKAQIVFLGDSITEGWRRSKDIWDKAFGADTPANFGIGGDRTQHVLWRIQNGELNGIKPKAACS